MTEHPSKPIHHGHAEKGFALPLALVAIASLALITLVGYRAVASATAVVTAMQGNAGAELALFSAEAETAFVFLSSPNIQGGIHTETTQQPAELSPFDEVDAADLTALDYWSANGQQRISNAARTPVFVTYYDASGFPPIGAMAEERLALFLRAAGFVEDAAVETAARLADYQDSDVRRRFRGAERAEYRLFNAAPPTNSPLRAPGELASVLEFSAVAPFESWDFILQNARFGGMSTQFKPQLGPPGLAAIFENQEGSAFAGDPLEGLTARDTQPTDTARFLLSHRAESGLTRRRAVEIMRTAGAADKPFRRVWIYDKAENDTGPAASEGRDMAPIFKSATDGDSR